MAHQTIVIFLVNEVCCSSKTRESSGKESICNHTRIDIKLNQFLVQSLSLFRGDEVCMTVLTFKSDGIVLGLELLEELFCQLLDFLNGQLLRCQMFDFFLFFNHVFSPR